MDKPNSALKYSLLEAVKTAMKSGDKSRLSTLRLITSEIKQVEVDQRKNLSDEDILKILQKMIKKRRQSLDIYTQAGRQDLAAKEADEITIIESYLPNMLSEAEIQTHLQAVIAETGAQSPKDMGLVMSALKPKLEDQADMSLVSKLVKAALS